MGESVHGTNCSKVIESVPGRPKSEAILAPAARTSLKTSIRTTTPTLPHLRAGGYRFGSGLTFNAFFADKAFMSPLRFHLLLISLAVVAGLPRANASGLYLIPRTYPSGNFPAAAAVQDFNHDGFTDIVSANVTDKTVSVFLNKGDGSFGTATTFAVGAHASEVASDDLDGDGNADLVVTDANAFVHVALGHGDGTFGAFTATTVANHPRGIAIGDFNDDGILDLALALFGPTKSFEGQVAVLIGHGDGSFAPPVFYDLDNVNATRLTATDLNNDGKLDLAVALQHGSRGTEGLGVLIGNGDGTFQPAMESVHKSNISDVAARGS